MKKFILLFALLAFTAPLHAADYIYKKGQDKWVSLSCTDAVTRANGDVLAPEEIAEVILYIDPVYGDVTDPLYTVTLPSGCAAAGTANIDLTMFPMRTDLVVYGVTKDTEGNVSSVVTPLEETKTFRINSAPPGPPGQMRLQRIDLNL